MAFLGGAQADVHADVAAGIDATIQESAGAVKHYNYFYVYDTCGSHATGHKNSQSLMIYIGNGRIKFFEYDAVDIMDADRQLTTFCEVKKIIWNEHPFTQVVCDFEEAKN